MDTVSRILELAERDNLSDQDLCKLLNAKKDKIYTWKKGRSTPTIDEVSILSDYFGVSVDYVMKGVFVVEKYERFIKLPLSVKVKSLRRELGETQSQFIAGVNMDAYPCIMNFDELYDLLNEVESAQWDFNKMANDSANAWALVGISAKLKEKFGMNYVYASKPSDELDMFVAPDEFPLNPYSRKLRLYRDAYHLAIDKLANLLGFEKWSVMSWESGEREPIERCKKIIDEMYNLLKNQSIPSGSPKMISLVAIGGDRVNINVTEEEYNRLKAIYDKLDLENESDNDR